MLTMQLFLQLVQLLHKRRTTRNESGRSGVPFKFTKKENEKCIVVCLRSPQNLEIGHFTLSFLQRTARTIVFAH